MLCAFSLDISSEGGCACAAHAMYRVIYPTMHMCCWGCVPAIIGIGVQCAICESDVKRQDIMGIWLGPMTIIPQGQVGTNIKTITIICCAACNMKIDEKRYDVLCAQVAKFLGVKI